MNIGFQFQSNTAWKDMLLSEINRTKPPVESALFRASLSDGLVLTIKLVRKKTVLATRKTQLIALNANVVKPFAIEICSKVASQYLGEQDD